MHRIDSIATTTYYYYHYHLDLSWPTEYWSGVDNGALMGKTGAVELCPASFLLLLIHSSIQYHNSISGGPRICDNSYLTVQKFIKTYIFNKALHSLTVCLKAFVTLCCHAAQRIKTAGFWVTSNLFLLHITFIEIFSLDIIFILQLILLSTSQKVNPSWSVFSSEAS